MEDVVMKEIADVKVIKNYKLELTFNDGVSGIIDLSDLVGEGVFSVWEDKQLFRNVKIGTAGELIWDGGVELCPDALYLKVTGKEPDDIFPSLKHEATHA
jgi:hypothetical protein